MSGLFYFKNILPVTVQNIFLKCIEHPIAKTYKKEVLSNNAFVLRLVAKPYYELNNNTIMNNYYSHVSYMWWSKYLVRDDEVYLPDEFDINNLKSDDILLDAIEDYVIS